MDITINAAFLPHTDPEASLAFYRDTLGFEVRLDVGGGKMRWITVGPPNQPDTNIVLYPPSATPGLTDDERRLIAEMMAKGTFGTLLLATKDLDGMAGIYLWRLPRTPKKTETIRHLDSVRYPSDKSLDLSDSE